MLDEQSWLQYLNQDDPAVGEALRVFRDGESFPKAPENKSDTKKAAKVAMNGVHPFVGYKLYQQKRMSAMT